MVPNEPDNDGFTVVPQDVFDARMSSTARGVLLYMASWPGRHIVAEELATAGDSADEIQAAFTELEALGFVRRFDDGYEAAVW